MQIVERPEDADFAFAHGTEAMGRGDGNEPVDTSIEDMNGLLQRCADKGGVPLVIANPDVVTVSGKGLVPMPGTLARTYSAMGGQVCFFPVSICPHKSRKSGVPAFYCLWFAYACCDTQLHDSPAYTGDALQTAHESFTKRTLDCHLQVISPTF